MTGPRMIWLDTPEAAQPELVGCKAASLARMQAAGFPSASGFVVGVPAFHAFLKHAELDAAVGQLGLSGDQHQVTNQIEVIRGGIEHASWQPEVSESITLAFDEMSSSVAVRSSGISEDVEQSAFAGAYESYLNCTTKREVLDAVKDCWKSAFSERVVAYRLHHGLLGASWLMGVIVQTMVFAHKAGVMFTRDPYSQHNHLLIEAVSGGCDKIVAGEPAELSVSVDRESRLLARIEQVNSPSTTRFGGGATGMLEAGRTMRVPRLLRRHEINALTEAGLRLEEIFGGPQDVEWAIGDKGLVILQARPLTASHGHRSTA